MLRRPTETEIAEKLWSSLCRILPAYLDGLQRDYRWIVIANFPIVPSADAQVSNSDYDPIVWNEHELSQQRARLDPIDWPLHDQAVQLLHTCRPSNAAVGIISFRGHPRKIGGLFLS